MEVRFIGIDISKRKFDVALLVGENGEKVKHKSCPHTQDGFQELIGWLERQNVHQAHVCMEATGEWYEGVASFLVEAGYQVSVVNPARIKGFAQSQMTRTKTDKSDAALIARFCQAMRPRLWSPPAPELKELQALVRRLDDLQEMQQMEKNRLESGVSTPSVIDSLKLLIAQLDAEIAKTKQLIDDHIKRHPGLKAQHTLLMSIPGIGTRTASAFLAEVGDISQFNSARELAAYCGLTPKEYTSGSSVRGKPCLSKMGNARLRKAFYMPALVASCWNPTVKAFYEHLLKNGKSKMAALGAAMRKLVHIAYGVLKHQCPYDPAYAA